MTTLDPETIRAKVAAFEQAKEEQATEAIACAVEDLFERMNDPSWWQRDYKRGLLYISFFTNIPSGQVNFNTRCNLRDAVYTYLCDRLGDGFGVVVECRSMVDFVCMIYITEKPGDKAVEEMKQYCEDSMRSLPID